MWLLASQVWASATFTESSTAISVSAIEAYPQLTLIFVAWLLIIFIARYTKSLFGRFILSAVQVLLFSTAAPIWFESASGSLNILRDSITAKTGISDWQAQLQLISQTSYNHLLADTFVIVLVLGFTLSLGQIWFGKNKGNSPKNLTRIDTLPKW